MCKYKKKNLRTMFLAQNSLKCLLGVS